MSFFFCLQTPTLWSKLIFATPRIVFRCQTFRTSDRWSVWSVWSIPTTVHDLDLSGQVDVWSVWSIPTTVHDLDLSGQTDSWSVWSSSNVAAWEPYNLQYLAHVSWVGLVLCRSCTTSHNGRWGTRWSRSWSIWSVCPRCETFARYNNTPFQNHTRRTTLQHKNLQG